MGRGTYRRRSSRKHKGGATNPPENDWGLHLYADIQHDFGNIGDVNFYNLNGAEAKTAAGYGGSIEERDVMTHLFQKQPETEETRQYMLEPLVFVVPERTQRSDATVVTPIANISDFGIVYDAGTFITTQLGARNVISFGNILDPASTTKDEESKPIFANVPDSTFQFPLSVFGFDPAKVGDICIKNVTKETAMVGINLDGKDRDAVSLAEIPICSANTAKSIRNIKIEECGIFTSLTKAAAAATEASKVEEGERNVVQKAAVEHQTWFKIGKTLGDTLLVASTMETIAGNKNPFLAGPWVDWISGAKVEGTLPTKFMLKTGDTLNHARAVLKGVPSILERPPSETKNLVKRYEFVPSKQDEVVPSVVENRYVGMKTNILSSIETGFQNLAKQLDSMIEGDKLKEFCEKTRVDSDISSLSQPSREKMSTLMATSIGTIKTHLESLSAKIIARLGDVVINQENYTDAMHFCRAATPNADVFERDRRTKNPLHPKTSIQVTTAASFGDINMVGLEIPYYNMLSRARSGRDPLEGDYRAIFFKRLEIFLDQDNGAGAGAGAGDQQGGGDAESFPSSPWEVPEIARKLALEPNTLGNIEFYYEAFNEVFKNKDVVTTEFPTINYFMKYFNDTTGETTILALCGLKEYSTANPGLELIEDVLVFNRLLEEFDRLELLGVFKVITEPANDREALIHFNLFVFDMYKDLAGEDIESVTRFENLKSTLLGHINLKKRGYPEKEEKRGVSVKPGASVGAEEDGAAAASGYDSPAPSSRGNEPETLERGARSPVSDSERSDGAAPSGMAGMLSPGEGSQVQSSAPSSGPGSPLRQAKLRREGEAEEGKTALGGLRRTYRKHKNDRNSTARVSRNAKHSRLRKRKGTRDSRRV